VFKEERDTSLFDWSMIGDIADGRPNMGPTMDVAVYRLMQFTLRDVIIRNFDAATAERIYYEAGELAGRQLYANVITQKTDFGAFVKELTEVLSTLKIGILRVEKADVAKLEFTLTVAEDLDCSGLPVCGESVCTYDEGFIAGLLSSFTGKAFEVKEVDCWCNGDRVCRFAVKPTN